MEEQSFMKIVATMITWFDALKFLFVWGFIKSLVYKTESNNIQELQTRI